MMRGSVNSARSLNIEGVGDVGVVGVSRVSGCWCRWDVFDLVGYLRWVF